MLPTVDMCGLNVTRLILGGNPFSGYSHQSHERNEEMLDYYTTERLKETLRRAEAAGINTTIMRSDPYIHRVLREYYNEDGKLQWIAQVGADSGERDIPRAIKAAARWAKAMYIHGAQIDHAYAEKNADQVKQWMEEIHKYDVPAGVAGHAPQAHLWVNELDVADFHVVAFYNCGSLHEGKGEKFTADDLPKSTAAIQKIEKPCIGYKIMAGGRVDAKEAFSFAFSKIKPTDAVNVGMYRGDNDNMVEDNVAMVTEILG